MKVQQISTSSCQTVYQVGDCRVILWIITGGEPALSFDDHSFMERFPIKDKRWSCESWSALGRYPHQDPDNMQGPTFDVLPDGDKTLIDFVYHNGPLHQTNNLRRVELVKAAGGLGATDRITSRRIHDAEDHTYGVMEADLRLHRFGRVLFSSPAFCGRPSDKMLEKAGKWWKEYADFITPIVDSNRYLYHELTDGEYQQFLSLLKKGFESKAIT